MTDIPIQTLFITELYLCQITMFTPLLHLSRNASRNRVCIEIPKYSGNLSDGIWVLLACLWYLSVHSVWEHIPGHSLALSSHRSLFLDSHRDRENCPTMRRPCPGEQQEQGWGLVTPPGTSWELPWEKVTLQTSSLHQKGCQHLPKVSLCTSPFFFWLEKREKMLILLP